MLPSLVRVGENYGVDLSVYLQQSPDDDLDGSACFDCEEHCEDESENLNISLQQCKKECNFAQTRAEKLVRQQGFQITDTMCGQDGTVFLLSTKTTYPLVTRACKVVALENKQQHTDRCKTWQMASDLGVGPSSLDFMFDQELNLSVVFMDPLYRVHFNVDGGELQDLHSGVDGLFGRASKEGLLHLDSHMNNIMSDGRNLRLIDWEAGIALPTGDSEVAGAAKTLMSVLFWNSVQGLAIGHLMLKTLSGSLWTGKTADGRFDITSAAANALLEWIDRSNSPFVMEEGAKERRRRILALMLFVEQREIRTLRAAQEEAMKSTSTPRRAALGVI